MSGSQLSFSGSSELVVTATNLTLLLPYAFTEYLDMMRMMHPDKISWFQFVRNVSVLSELMGVVTTTTTTTTTRATTTTTPRTFPPLPDGLLNEVVTATP